MTGQRLKEIHKKLYGLAEDNCYGWSRWAPNEAWRNGFEGGVDTALKIVAEELGVYRDYHFGKSTNRTDLSTDEHKPAMSEDKIHDRACAAESVLYRHIFPDGLNGPRGYTQSEVIKIISAAVRGEVE